MPLRLRKIISNDAHYELYREGEKIYLNHFKDIKFAASDVMRQFFEDSVAHDAKLLSLSYDCTKSNVTLRLEFCDHPLIEPRQNLPITFEFDGVVMFNAEISDAICDVNFPTLIVSEINTAFDELKMAASLGNESCYKSLILFFDTSLCLTLVFETIRVAPSDAIILTLLERMASR